jgi:hypothetical protein
MSDNRGSQPQRSIVLDTMSSLILLCALEADNLVKGPKELQAGLHWLARPLRRGTPSRFRDHSATVLSSALLHGGLHLLLDSRVSARLDLSSLRDAGVPLTFHSPYQPRRLKYLQQLYDRTFDLARQLEHDPRIAKVVSFEQLCTGHVPHMAHDVFATALEEYRHCRRLFARELDWVEALSPELRDLLVRHAAGFQGAFEDTYGDFSRSVREAVIATAPASTTAPPDLLDAMKLAPSEAFEAPLSPSDLFPTSYFREFSNLDLMLSGLSLQNDFREFAERGMFFAFTDPEKFKYVHAVWTSVLQLRTILDLSRTETATILLPGGRAIVADHPVSGDDRRIQLFRLYVREVNAVPRLETAADLLRLYHHRDLRAFRDRLEEWHAAVEHGERRVVERMRGDWRVAMRDLRRAGRMQRIGELMTIIALPVGVAGLLAGLPLDFAFTALGPGILAYTRYLESGTRWVRFGDAG